MRKIMVTSVLAVSALAAGVSAGALQASDSGSAGATPTTNPLDMLTSLGLTNEQIGCLVSNGASLDTEDIGQMMDLMTQCGVDVMELATNMSATTVATAPIVASTPTVVGQPGTLDPADIREVLTLLGVTEADAACLQTGLLTSAGDDAAALTVLQNCGLSLDHLLLSVVAANGQAGGLKPDETATTLAAIPVPGNTAAPSGDPMIASIQQQLAALGITITDEQASCLASNLGTGDTNDPTVLMNLLTTCGIDLTDLNGG